MVRASAGLHIILIWMILGAAALHVAAVIYHSVFTDRRTIRRMLDVRPLAGPGLFCREMALRFRKELLGHASRPGDGNERFFNLGLQLASAGISETEKSSSCRSDYAHTPEDRRRRVASIIESLKGSGVLLPNSDLRPAHSPASSFSGCSGWPATA